jgi:hypothetical protein
MAGSYGYEGREMKASAVEGSERRCHPTDPYCLYPECNCASLAPQTACLSGIASGEACEPSTDNLKRCRICGFVIDANFAEEKPSIDFSMRGRGTSREATVKEKLIAALKPFANIHLARDSDPSQVDRIEAPDLAITPKDVRRARTALIRAEG